MFADRNYSKINLKCDKVKSPKKNFQLQNIKEFLIFCRDQNQSSNIAIYNHVKFKTLAYSYTDPITGHSNYIGTLG